MNQEPLRARPSDSAWSLGREGGSGAVWVLALIVAVGAFVPFWPALSNDFVNWDDDLYLTGHTQWRGLSWGHIRWMFTTTHGGPYQPLSWLSWAVDHAIWGMNPRGFHLTSMVLHAANAAVFFLIALALLERAAARTARSAVCAGAVIAALLFAAHPLRVESVAWATERRDVLSGLFYLLSVLAYLRWWSRAADQAAGRCRGWPGGAFVLFVLALFAKGMSVTLPVVLLVLDAYPLRRIRFATEPDTPWFTGDTRRAILEKVPFLVASLVIGAVAVWGVRTMGPFARTDLLLTQRLMTSCYAACFYISKSVWPVGLSPLYEFPLRMSLGEARFWGSVLVFAATCVLVYRWRRRLPGVAAAWVCYLVVLAPVSGLLQAGPQIAADRYTYLATLSLALLIGGAFAGMWAWAKVGRKQTALSAIAAAVTVCLAVLTWRQTLAWRDSMTLWQHAYRVNPDSWNAKRNLGIALAQEKRLDEAIALYRQAVEANPGDAKGHYNLGNALAQQGNGDAALKHYEQAVELDPGYADARLKLGVALGGRGRAAEALEHFEAAVQARPGWVEARVNLGTCLLQLGRTAEAIERYQEALRVRPASVLARVNLGHALHVNGKLREAEQAFREALRLNPASAEGHWGLARVLAEQGRTAEAAVEGHQALRLDPQRRDIRRWLEGLPPREE
ncbi:MAG: tetratricopeptide repeat protein [Phycisphaerales bacterium]|nr:MAG: tetratricopeptide repeat protein [Phycisphaerales bacterium]